MKKLILVALIFGVALFSYGCQTASSPASSTTAPSGTAVAGSIGSLMFQTLAVDGTAAGLLSVPGLGVKAVTDSNYVGGWWTYTFSTTGMSYSFKVKAYKADGTEITHAVDLDLTNKLAVWTTLAMSGTTGTVDFAFGTEIAPLTFDGIISGAKSLNGPATLTASDSTGSFTISLNYSSLTLDTAGYPSSGTVNFSLSSTAYAATAGTVTFNSNHTASLVYTSPSSLTGTTYVVDLTNGNVTTASVD